MGFGDLGAGVGDLFNGDELLASAGLLQGNGCCLAQTSHRGERRAEGALLLVHDEVDGIGFIDVHPLEGETAQIELIADFQRGEHVLLYGGGILVLSYDLTHLLLTDLHTAAHELLVEGLGADGEVGV